MNEQAISKDHALKIPELSRRARLRRIAIVVLLVGAGVAAYRYYSRPAPVVELYRTDEIKRRTLVQLVEATGSLDVRSRVEVPSPIAGRLTAVFVQSGQRVEAGEPLATLDERAAELAVKSAQAAIDAAAGRVAQAKAALEEAKRTEEQLTRLKERGLSSEHELSGARSSRERAKAALEAARGEQKLAGQSAETAKLGKSFGKIVAPAGGIVLRAPENVGAAVSPERGPLFVIGEPLDVMRIEARVTETDIAVVKKGQKAEVLVQALPGRVFAAEVTRIGIEPEREGGVVSYPVTLLVENAEHTLLPGMSARVRMEVARAENVLSVHEAALRFAPEDAEPAPARSRVFLRQSRTEIEAVAVQTGLSDGVYTELKSTGATGDESEDATVLAEGDRVALGLLRPDTGKEKPQVTLGGKK